MNAIAQKVGEEAVELIIESKDQDDERFRNEAADLLYHFLVLLRAKDIDLSQARSAEKRNGSSSG
jgi:phosphoribosyl-ATP pyrophosphohydrolase/phosphoribosyl-AMP cyclohydrolase